MPKVESPSLVADQVYEAIRNEIMSGALPAGHHLRVRDLAAQVGTSVMPVRDALRRLEEAGLAERSPRRGTVVKGLTLEELRHVYAVRAVLEVEATRLGGRHVPPDAVAAMRAALDDIRRAVTAGDPVGAIDGDEALLRHLYRCADNPVLLDVIEGLWRRCRAYKLLGARRALESDGTLLWSFQAQLLDAVQQQDLDTAVGVAEASLARAAERIEQELDGA